ncbi:uncharacterized protein LOC107981599 [Nasonia vitripennis]|uniref:Uncharacterized protein n=1 Tax=Nasonia vitripennis TaxID=7425 RepID=A0A7M7ITI5_NASVI|nr:uncharacterized protein LOC107981599 [Nasonia vitripennis]
MSDHGGIDDELAHMAIENGGEGNGNDVEFDVPLSDEEMEEIPNPQPIIFNLNQQDHERGLQVQGLDNAVGEEALPDQRNARAQGIVEAQRHANPGLRNSVASRRQLQGQEYADVASGRRQPPGLINAAGRSGQPQGQGNPVAGGG